MDSNKKNTTTGGGITFLGLLTICFIVQKLIGVIHWSWVWVLAPIWMPLLAVGVILLIVFIMCAMPGEHRWKSRRRK